MPSHIGPATVGGLFFDDGPLPVEQRGCGVILFAWILAYAVLALIFVRYYQRWQADFTRLTDAAEPRSFGSFVRDRVDDPELERRRRMLAWCSYGLMAFGVAGLVIPL
jgi:hypothetical protein